MITVFKIIALVFGAFVGFNFGLHSATVGGHYEDGLDEEELQTLREKFSLFRFADTKIIKAITIILGTPIIIGLIFIAGTTIKCLFPQLILHVNEDFYLAVILYMLGYLMFGFVGYLVCGFKQMKIRRIND